MVYKGKALQMQNTVRPSIRAMPANKRRLWAVCVPVGLLALILAGDGQPVKRELRHEPQAWEIRSKIVVEQGLIWEVDE